METVILADGIFHFCGINRHGPFRIGYFKNICG